jgi:MerR family copper efflux transcriptional regulator
MHIADAAHAVGTTSRALRWYEQRGLVEVTRSPSGYREYGPAELTRLRNIRALLDLGFTIDDIVTFGPFLDRDLPERFAADPGGPCEVALTRTRDRLATLDRRIAGLTEVRDRLAASLATPVG